MFGAGVCVTLVGLLALTHGSLLDALKAVHANPSFHNLQPAEQILIIELIAEVEAGELKAYIDEAGFHHVLAIIDKLPAAEAHILTSYLVQELEKEEAVNATMPVGKRDLTPPLDPVMAHIQQLPMHDQQIIKDVIVSAENGNLTAYIEHIGYSTILNLMDGLPDAEGHMLEVYLFQHIASERGN